MSLNFFLPIHLEAHYDLENRNNSNIPSPKISPRKKVIKNTISILLVAYASLRVVEIHFLQSFAFPCSYFDTHRGKRGRWHHPSKDLCRARRSCFLCSLVCMYIVHTYMRTQPRKQKFVFTLCSLSFFCERAEFSSLCKSKLPHEFFLFFCLIFRNHLLRARNPPSEYKAVVIGKCDEAQRRRG